MRRVRFSLLVLLIVLPLARIVATYPVFSQTVDEPVHVGGGLAWLTMPGYDYDPEHPPLARIAFALDAWMHGVRFPTSEHLRASIGNAILYRDGRYVRNLAAARMGNLPFFLVALAAVGLWTRRLFGDDTALVALALFGTLPPILGHAALATTDLAVGSVVTAALYALALWLDAPTLRRALLLGITIGLGLLTKFSFILYFPLGALVLLLARARDAGTRSVRGRSIVTAVLATALIVWAGYKFDVGTLAAAQRTTFPPSSDTGVALRYADVPSYTWVRPDLITRFHEYCAEAKEHGVVRIDFIDWAKAAGYPSPLAGRHGRDTMAGLPPPTRPPLESLHAAWHWIDVHLPLPAPYFFAGLEYVQWHSTVGHPAFLLGRVSSYGWWYYFPIVWFFKTPLPFVLLSLVGIWIAAAMPLRSGQQRESSNPRSREAAAVALAPLVMFIPAMAGGINIGIRHILPIYPLLTIPAAFALVQLWRRRRVIAIVLAAWLAIETTLAHPDYLAWFNEAAGRHPERIANDSTHDWGQDLLRLADVVRRERLTPLHLAYFGSADVHRHIAHYEDLKPKTPAHGWVAVSEMMLALNDGDYTWLEAYTPVRQIGRSIRLYRVP
jgi:4-amino-4-deoxy-L-arabinose transferase-like glycosyltransferase